MVTNKCSNQTAYRLHFISIFSDPESLVAIETEDNVYANATISVKARPRGYKTFFVLNSVEHEILNAHKYKDIKKFSFL